MQAKGAGRTTFTSGPDRDITCSTVEKNSPAAMAFNLLTQVFRVCPAIEAQLATQYDEVKTMGDYHIYMRKPGPS